MATLELKDLHVALEDGTPIVKGVDLTVNSGEVHAIMMRPTEVSSSGTISVHARHACSTSVARSTGNQRMPA